jgi:nitrogen PTS system EIIA component
MHDSLLTGKQLAAYLNVNERTVQKLVADGSLPGVKVGNQWRFRRAMIDTWLDDQMLGVAPRLFAEPQKSAEPQRRMLALDQCFRPGYILPDMLEQTKATAIEELAAFAAKLGLVRDRSWFARALLQRENVMPSAAGNGVAFMHTLRRHPAQVVQPFMVLGRHTAGVDFDALDGEVTHLFFVLGLKYEELELPWLYKLSQMLARPEAVRSLLAAPDPQRMYEVLAQAELALAAPHPGAVTS